MKYQQIPRHQCCTALVACTVGGGWLP